MKTPKQIIERIAEIAPDVSVGVDWSHDPDSSWQDIAECMEDEDPDDWQPWNSEVKACAIVNGVLLSESEYLGGTWEKFGDDPAKSNPDISGYFPQMVDGALKNLGLQAVIADSPIFDEIQKAREFLRVEMRERHNEQRAKFATV